MWDQKRILLTGAGGQLGKSFREVLLNRGVHDLIPAGREELDITDTEAIGPYLDKNEIRAVINCAAYTQVDQAESDFENAMKVNFEAVKMLAEQCAGREIPLIHFSTDYVYHNNLNRPLREDDPLSPGGKYGISKLEGEQAIRKIDGPHYIMRTSWVYSEFGSNFLKTMLGLATSNKHLKVVFDQVGAPTYTRDIVHASLKLLEFAFSDEQPSRYGTYNFSNEGVCSWYDFALAIFEEADKPIEVDPVLTISFPRPAPRPTWSVLDKSKIKESFGLKIRHWREAMKDCLGRIRN